MDPDDTFASLDRIANHIAANWIAGRRHTLKNKLFALNSVSHTALDAAYITIRVLSIIGEGNIGELEVELREWISYPLTF